MVLRELSIDFILGDFNVSALTVDESSLLRPFMADNQSLVDFSQLLNYKFSALSVQPLQRSKNGQMKFCQFLGFSFTLIEQQLLLQNAISVFLARGGDMHLLL